MTTSEVCVCARHAVSVLFVDDDVDTLFAYHLVATEEGMSVELAREGREAITLASVLLPDVIVLDLGLRDVEGLGGLEVLRRLRASERTSAIPVVILSGFNSAHDAAQIRASGCDGHLVKPCSADELIGLLTSLARGRRVQSASLEASTG